MRTTITLEDQLLDRLKSRAAESRTSVSGLIEQAVQLFMRTPPGNQKADHFDLVTFGRGGRFSRHNIDKTSRLIADDDLDRYAERH